MKIKAKALSPIIATILLVVVAVILVSIILSFGKSFTAQGLDKSKDIKDLSSSDAGLFIYPKSFSEGVLQISYQPPANIQEPVIITSYRILEVSDMDIVSLSTPFTLTNNSTNILSLDCLYEYSVESPEMTIQLITEDNTYINVKQRDQKMVCTSAGDGSEEDPIVICNAEDLNAVRDNLDYNYSLGKDIDLQCFTRQDVNGWEPIGTEDTYFEGIFDGDDHTISNLYINRPTTDFQGLFGYLGGTNPTIKNLELVDVNITGHGNVGALVGVSSDNANSILNNITVTNANIFSHYYFTGGIIGANYSGTLSNSHSTGNIHGLEMVGGLVGYQDGNISNSYSTGSVSGTRHSVGGLVGLQQGNISDSYSTGSVSSTGNDVGGLVGYQKGNISNCYSTGSVSSTGNDVGGLVGSSSNGESILESYSSGSVSGTSYVGGLVGSSYGPISNSFSSGSVSGTGYSVGGLVGSSSGPISNSFSTSSVSSTGNGVGGLVGSSYGPISNSFSTSSVSSTSHSVGGLVGSSSGAISNCFSTGSVFSGTGLLGGLVGNQNSGIISNSYSLGDVNCLSVNQPVGGFIGVSGAGINNCYSTGKVIYTGSPPPIIGGFSGIPVSGNNYWDMNTSLQTTSGGGATGLTTEEMKDSNNFTGWDFTTIWAIDAGTTYPYLRNNTQNPLPQ